MLFQNLECREAFVRLRASAEMPHACCRAATPECEPHAPEVDLARILRGAARTRSSARLVTHAARRLAHVLRHAQPDRAFNDKKERKRDSTDPEARHGSSKERRGELESDRDCAKNGYDTS